MRIEADPDRCRLYLMQANERLELPPLWLRERSPDPEQYDPASHQRLFDPHQLPGDLAVTDLCADGDALTIAFSDGHAARYSSAALLSDLESDDGLPRPIPWRSDSPPDAAFDWHRIGVDEVLREVLTTFLTYGFVILRQTPTAPRSILAIAETFGFELRFKLDPGELMMFDKIRVLHDRTEFDPNEGPRQLQGCYIDREGLRSLYRVACRGG